MKMLIISAMALVLSSATMTGIAAKQMPAQQTLQNQTQNAPEINILSTLKNAFKFGLQTGWQKTDK